MLLTLIPLLIMAVGLEAYFLHDRSSSLDHDLMERGKLITHQIASSSEYGVFSNNQPFLQIIVQGALQEPDVRGIIIQNADAESLIEAGEFSETTKRKVAEASVARYAHPTKADLPQVDKYRGIVNLQTPIFGNGESLWIYQPIIPVQVALDDFGDKPAIQQVGAVIVEMSWERTAKLKSKMLWVTIGVTTLFLMLTLFLLYRASRRITIPICELSDAVLKIGKGHLETRVFDATHVTELSTLARGINDMTAQLQQENAILHQRAEEATRLAAVAFESHEGMLVTDVSGVIVRVNDAFTRITGFTAEDSVGQTPSILRSGRHDADFYDSMWKSIRQTGSWQGEVWNRHKNGNTFPALVTISEVRGEDGKVAFYVATYTDITLRKAAENEIKNLAFNDPLTRLPNRLTLMERLNQTMSVSKRSGKYGALLFIDLDNFKPLNDQYGHEAGDSLLIEVAQRLSGCIREVDTVARFGGDEFVVMVSELDGDKSASCEQARLVAEKIRSALQEPYVLAIRKDGQVMDSVKHQCTSSIGVRLFFGHEASIDDILRQADLAMYQAKKNGRNSVFLGDGE
jgi:diguanylate cyclase (GGDEF)-like protein/PAS domain S-box-containing protein